MYYHNLYDIIKSIFEMLTCVLPKKYWQFFQKMSDEQAKL